MRCVVVPCFTAPGVKAWVADKDCVLVGTHTTAGRITVSENPAQADLNTAPAAADGVKFDVLTYNDRSAASTANQLKIPIIGGRTYYITNSSTTWALLYLEDSVESIAT